MRQFLLIIENNNNILVLINLNFIDQKIFNITERRKLCLENIFS